ncbi:tetratricopeptide repeat protein [Prosthecobacter sp.]|jgi:hypothetical protein|uniref:tetratricopeptide repeat protein n=1 Tax=Prosthecobacter sp. TaxID=1965333 RepID=UPI0037C85C3B
MAFQFDSDSQKKIPDQIPPRERIGKFSLLVIGAFVLLIVCLFAWHPMATAVRGVLARRNAKEALQATAAKDWVKAHQAVTLARQRAPEDEEVMLAMVAFLKATGSDPGGLAQYLQKLKLKRPLTAEEELTLGRALISSGKTKDAREVYEKLPLKQSTQQPGLELLSSILNAEGHTKEAAEIEQRAVVLSKAEATPETQMKAAVADLGSHFVEVQNQAQKQLWQLAELSTQTGMDAILQLAASRGLTQPQANRLMELEEKHPLQAMGARLLVVSAQMRLQPERRAELAEAEVRRFTETKNGRLEDIAYWLMRGKFNDQVLKLVPKDLAAQSRELYPILVQTLSQAERWEELQGVLKIPNPPVSATLLDLAMAEVLSHVQPDMRESRRILQGTVINAAQAGDVATLQVAAQLAEKLNFADVACQAYKAAGMRSAENNASEAALQNLQKSVELALRAKDTETLLEVSRRLHVMSPSSAVFADRFVYLRLVLGVEMETVDVKALMTETEAKGAVSVTLERIPPPLLLALSAYRLGDREGMAKHLASLPRGESLSPGPRAVAAGLLSLVGKADRAFVMAEKIPGALLLEEEKVFLMRAL